MTTDVIILKNTLRIYDSFNFTSYFDIFKAKKRVAKFLGPTKILSNETNPCSYLNGVNTKLISCYVLKVNNKDIRTRSIVVILMYLILAIKKPAAHFTSAFTSKLSQCSCFLGPK